MTNYGTPYRQVVRIVVIAHDQRGDFRWAVSLMSLGLMLRNWNEFGLTSTSFSIRQLRRLMSLLTSTIL